MTTKQIFPINFLPLLTNRLYITNPIGRINIEKYIIEMGLKSWLDKNKIPINNNTETITIPEIDPVIICPSIFMGVVLSISNSYLCSITITL